jgi:hypothetical protein
MIRTTCDGLGRAADDAVVNSVPSRPMGGGWMDRKGCLALGRGKKVYRFSRAEIGEQNWSWSCPDVQRGVSQGRSENPEGSVVVRIEHAQSGVSSCGRRARAAHYTYIGSRDAGHSLQLLDSDRKSKARFKEDSSTHRPLDRPRTAPIASCIGDKYHHTFCCFSSTKPPYKYAYHTKHASVRQSIVRVGKAMDAV